MTSPHRLRQDSPLSQSDKILTADTLPAWREALRSKGKTLAATNGCFDIFHAGHVNYLRAARAEADALLVGLNSDRSVRELKGQDRPIHTEADRAAVRAALEVVSAVVVFDELRATRFLNAAQPDVYIKGGDFSVDELPLEERQAVGSHGGRVAVLGFVPGKSSSDIARRIQQGR